MKVIEYPLKSDWSDLLRRPTEFSPPVSGKVAEILSDVRLRGDLALREYTRRFDGVEPADLTVSRSEFDDAEAAVPQRLKDAILAASENIEHFHRLETFHGYETETVPGVICRKKWLPIRRVGLYVPAGSAPLFSSVLMLAIPARLAGCREVILCSPPGREGRIDPATLFAARVCGVSGVFKVGGAQAVAALAYGTESVTAVHKIFGPGNSFVTEAKLQVMRDGVAIDMPAGPSELAVIADKTCEPAFVAADLLSQAEHGTDSQVMLVSTSARVIRCVLEQIERQISELPRREIAAAALGNSRAFLVGSIDDGIELLNEYAPEHLIIATANADAVAEKVTDAGSVFIGNYSCESAGDYASGTNHTLPTNGAARAFSGVSVLSFMKSITFQKLTKAGIDALGPTIEIMADAEGLAAHRNAVSIRLAHKGGRV
jgi:histidinol dehydrogenase